MGAWGGSGGGEGAGGMSGGVGSTVKNTKRFMSQKPRVFILIGHFKI